ncbi:hypothetical protein BDB00DRAFT_800897, partial [Zychaea mexicana]|uniref:uncharacterized protein n=1 Tax=Zychaea mexicana TaxID=64656 RepID=UPI0022FDB6F7
MLDVESHTNWLRFGRGGLKAGVFLNISQQSKQRINAAIVSNVNDIQFLINHVQTDGLLTDQKLDVERGRGQSNVGRGIHTNWLRFGRGGLKAGVFMNISHQSKQRINAANVSNVNAIQFLINHVQTDGLLTNQKLDVERGRGQSNVGRGIPYKLAEVWTWWIKSWAWRSFFLSNI